MSLQRLGPKWLRRLSVVCGEPVKIGWGNGGHVFSFATASHRHGRWDSREGPMAWEDGDGAHVSSCYGEEWPEELRAVRSAPPAPVAGRPALAAPLFIEPPAIVEDEDPDVVRWIPASELAR